MNSLTKFISEKKALIANDLMSSVVVFLVALPLCMGVAIASGVPPAKGLITGIIGGLIVGALAGCQLQVSGPAAGLSVLIFQIIQTHGLEALGIIILMAGVLQILASILRLGQWFRASPPAVIEGMLGGIGVLIIASQVHVMVDDLPRGSGLKNLISIPEAFYKGVMPSDDTVHHLAAMIGILSIGIMIVWSFVPKKLKAIPAPLVAVIVATVVAFVLKMPIKYVSVPSSLINEMTFPSLSKFSILLDPSIMLTALAVAIIASAETLLSATAVDQMHNGPRTKYDKEMFAQGVGNSICGFIGALPMTGVIVRSSANVNAGAKSRLSTMFHGFWILMFILFLPTLLGLIPTTSLAAILVFTGFKLVMSKNVSKLLSFGRSEFAIYLATIIGIVATDLLKGVMIGIGLSLFKLLYNFSHLDIRLVKTSDKNRATLYLKGAATFVRLPQLASTLDMISPEIELHIKLENLNYIDQACLELLANWKNQHESAGGVVIIEIDSLHDKLTNRAKATNKINTGELSITDVPGAVKN